jgi:hypothetical protein
MMNGKPVPGAFGYCPTGSKWEDNVVPSAPVEPNADPSQFGYGMDEESLRVMQEDKPLQRIDIGPGTLKTLGTTAIGTAMASPAIRAGFNALKNNKGAIGSKLKDLMGKLIMKKSTTYPINSAEKGWAWYKGLKGVDKVKAMSLLGTGVAIQQVMSSMTGEDEDSKAKPAPAFMNDAQRMSQMDNSVPEKTTMQKLGDNMKDPKWWTESISGLPSDTRLMRMGQLMDYYGKKPKGRQASTAPAELWAKNEAASQAAKAKVLAAGSGSSGTFLSKMGDDAQTAAIEQEVKAKLGLSDWNPINGPAGSNSAAVTTTVARVKGLIQQYVASGMDWDKALTLAMSQVTK